jgi:hypothetical protein
VLPQIEFRIPIAPTYLSTIACIFFAQPCADLDKDTPERSDLDAADFWRFLFQEFSIPFPDELYRYSRDLAGEFPTAPAYYNLGFVALNWSALRIVKNAIFDVCERLNKIIQSEMRCQIALKLISYKHAFKRRHLPAIFNAANDEAYLQDNGVAPRRHQSSSLPPN